MWDPDYYYSNLALIFKNHLMFLFVICYANILYLWQKLENKNIHPQPYII